AGRGHQSLSDPAERAKFRQRYRRPQKAQRRNASTATGNYAITSRARLGREKREYGKYGNNGNNGIDGDCSDFFRVFRYFRLFRTLSLTPPKPFHASQRSKPRTHS